MEFEHKPIMVEECLRLLAPQRGGIFVDGTLGGGGHAEASWRRCPRADGSSGLIGTAMRLKRRLPGLPALASGSAL